MARRAPSTGKSERDSSRALPARRTNSQVAGGNFARSSFASFLAPSRKEGIVFSFLFADVFWTSMRQNYCGIFAPLYRDTDLLSDGICLLTVTKFILFDFHLPGGVHGNDPFLGAAWAGDIAGAGFRGEVAAKKINNETKILFPHLRGSWSSTFVLSADYTFTQICHQNTLDLQIPTTKFDRNC